MRKVKEISCIPLTISDIKMEDFGIQLQKYITPIRQFSTNSQIIFKPLTQCSALDENREEHKTLLNFINKSMEFPNAYKIQNLSVEEAKSVLVNYSNEIYTITQHFQNLLEQAHILLQIIENLDNHFSIFVCLYIYIYIAISPMLDVQNCEVMASVIVEIQGCLSAIEAITTNAPNLTNNISICINLLRSIQLLDGVVLGIKE